MADEINTNAVVMPTEGNSETLPADDTQAAEIIEKESFGEKAGNFAKKYGPFVASSVVAASVGAKTDNVLLGLVGGVAALGISHFVAKNGEDWIKDVQEGFKSTNETGVKGFMTKLGHSFANIWHGDGQVYGSSVSVTTNTADNEPDV